MPKETFLNLPLEKQEKIIREAVKEFLEKGFEKGNVGVIAKNAGVAKGSMYQYFENKKELFIFTVHWCMDFMMNKYGKKVLTPKIDVNIFDFVCQNAKETWMQFREEREICIFVQDVFLGKFSGVSDEPIAYMLKLSNEYILQLIREGKRNGSVRKDIDDQMLCIFLSGATIKFKEHLMIKARAVGEDFIDEDYETNELEITNFIKLLKSGMEGK